MKRATIYGVLLGLIALGVIFWRIGILKRLFSASSGVHISLIPAKKSLPLLKYTIPALRQRSYQSNQVTVLEKIADFPTFSSYLFSFQTLDKKMTGQLNVPKLHSDQALPIIVLVRGHVPMESYQTGIGTKPAAAVFAEHGYVTLAPDFFGYGGSDPESSDSWEARFQKPISVVELIESLKKYPKLELPAELSSNLNTVQVNPQQMGMWAHSNGGQIALTALEILNQPLPTTLWAPVTAPFPYSILYFSDEESDEGKVSRAWVANFEKDYDTTQFSLTDFLFYLQGPLQIHQGEKDEAIHYVWSQEFVDKLKTENQNRKNLLQQKEKLATESVPDSTQAAELQKNLATHPYLKPISISFFSYPETDHSMRPAWNTVIQRDLDFFAKNLK